MKSFIEKGGLWVLVQAGLLSGAVVLGPWGRAVEWSITALGVGGVLIGVALAVVVFGARALGKNLTPFPHPTEGGGLVSHGIYAHVRHPLYSGVLLGTVGWGVVWLSWPALGIALVLLPFFRLKAHREEKLLLGQFPEYADYQRAVPALIPVIWKRKMN